MKIFNAYTKQLITDLNIVAGKGQITDAVLLGALAGACKLQVARATVGGGKTVGAEGLVVWLFPTTVKTPAPASTPAGKQTASDNRAATKTVARKGELTRGEKIALAAYHNRLARKQAVAG